MRGKTIGLAAVLLMSCGKKEAEPSAKPGGSTFAKDVTAALDAGKDPCVDFYQYACGSWLESAKIPADRASWTRSFSTIDDRNEDLVLGILKAAAADPGTNPDTQRIGAYFGSCMDEAAVDAAGAGPIKPLLARIDAVTDTKTFARAVGEMQLYTSPLFGAYADGDFKDPKQVILHVFQGGLGLPDRDYYLKEGADAQALRDAYVAHIGEQLKRAGVAEPEAAAKAVFAFELDLAKTHKPPEELRDPVATYHRIDRVGLQALSPHFDWAEVFAGQGFPDLTAINVTDPDQIKAMDVLLAAQKPETLRAYLKWHVVKATAGQLDKGFAQANFDFFGAKLVGQKEMRSREKRCVDWSTAAYGEIIGKVYVEKAFPGNSKGIAVGMITDIEASFETNLATLDWMDDETRVKAVEKMKKIKNKIGYPDVWRDYSALNPKKDSFFDNWLTATQFEAKRQYKKVGGPTDPGEWYMTPAEVNAYYNPLGNEIAFPAGILQPPFFDASYPPAMNYGAIGMVMGHELTHGFDDGGAQFDGDGRLVQWWNDQAVKKFGERTQCVVDQYNGYTLRDDLKVNGELTQGENIADLGGLKQSYYAFLRREPKAKEPSAVPGLTNEQLFFVAFAQGWCSKITPQMEQLRVTTDPHSPPRFRVNGPASAFPEFAKAFSCKDGAPMAPTQRCTVW